MRQVAVVVGVGPARGLGASLARRFARGGMTVFVAGRTKERLARVSGEIGACGGRAVPIVADATCEEQVSDLFAVIDQQECIPELVTCTVDRTLRAPLEATEADAFEALWRANCLAAFLVGREAVRRMAPARRGTIIFTGASASLRARPSFTAFASAKFALRALAQGMAREYGPTGIHVAHVVIDGVIDGDRTRAHFPELVEVKGDAGLLQPESIAETYWQLHRQSSDAWTHELDLRPFTEAF